MAEKDFHISEKYNFRHALKRVVDQALYPFEVNRCRKGDNYLVVNPLNRHFKTFLCKYRRFSTQFQSGRRISFVRSGERRVSWEIIMVSLSSGSRYYRWRGRWGWSRRPT